MVEIVSIPPQDIDLIWERVSHQIDSALSHTKGELKLSTVYDRLIANEILLLVVADKNQIAASIVVEFPETDGPKVCHIMACGGDKADLWLDKWYDAIIPIAKEQGCSRLALTGRKGWIKKLSKYGFKHAYTTLEQDI